MSIILFHLDYLVIILPIINNLHFILFLILNLTFYNNYFACFTEYKINLKFSYENTKEQINTKVSLFYLLINKI